MESLGMIVIIVLAIWYLGSSINAILSKAGKLSEREFEVFELNQGLRLKKTRAEIKTKISQLGEETMTDEELKTLLGL